MKEFLSRRRLVRITLISIASLVVIWLGSMALLAGLLLTRANRLRQAAADPSRLNLSALAGDVHAARSQFSILHAELAPVLWVASLFPGNVGAVKPLADAGSQMLIAADEALQGLDPSLDAFELSSLSGDSLPEILSALDIARPALAQAQSHVDSAAADLDRVKGPLSPRLGGVVSLARQAVSWAKTGFDAAQVAPGLLAQSGSRTYLLLLQNSDELRATGGFISAVGIIRLDHGKIVDMSVKDVYALDDWTKYHPDPPQPLYDYMRSEQWALCDANWSPDFPTVAQDVIRLYQIAHPGQVDGVVGITVQGVEMFIAGLSPLKVEGLSEPVTPQNFSQILQDSWNPDPDLSNSSVDLVEWFKNRKQAIGLVMSTALGKVLSGQADWPALAQGVLKAFDQRQLMLYTPAEADQLNRMQWDGSLRTIPGDYLMVVDSNVGFNKANSLVSQTVDYQVNLQPDGAARAVVQVDYVHTGKQAGVVCNQFKKYDKNVTYAALSQSCYYDFLRLLVPSGARLDKSLPQPVSSDILLPAVPTAGQAVASEDELLGRTVISQFFVVKYGSRLNTRFEVELPVVVTSLPGQKQYHLLLQKQPGTDAIPVKVEITLPDGARLVSSTPVSTLSSAGSLTFSLHLDVDREISVVYTTSP